MLLSACGGLAGSEWVTVIAATRTQKYVALESYSRSSPLQIAGHNRPRSALDTIAVRFIQGRGIVLVGGPATVDRAFETVKRIEVYGTSISGDTDGRRTRKIR